MLLCVMEPSEVTLTDNHFSILHFIALRRHAVFLLCQQTDSRIMKKDKAPLYGRGVSADSITCFLKSKNRRKEG